MPRVMKTSAASRSLTGLAAGASLAAALLGVLALGSLIGLPNVAFGLFEWLVRVLPGRVVVFGLETTLRLLEGLGFNIKDTAKAVEAALAFMGLFVPVAIAGLLFFVLIAPSKASHVRRRGAIVGAGLGVLLVVVIGTEDSWASFQAMVDAVWVVGVFLAWGWGLGRLYGIAYPDSVATLSGRDSAHDATAHAEARPGGDEAVPSDGAPSIGSTVDSTELVEVERLDRRHFIIRMSGLVATLVVLGAEVAQVLRVKDGPPPSPPLDAPIPFPNADSPVRPVPGTRPEYTPVADHFQVDIDLTPRQIDVSSWRLRIGGLVAHAMALTYDQILEDYASRDQFVTLACVSNPVGGPLIGTTLWSGPSLRDVLADAQPLPTARYAHLMSDDGFDEVVDLASIQADARILLAHAWDGQPLTASHGFPLRVFVPDVYGMKQPKWITEIVLVSQFIPGYWVERGWDERAQVRTTSVIDTVATSDPITRGGKTFVSIGGIAEAGSRGVSKVEVQIDDGPWEAAELRQPLSQLTWALWRYEWPWSEGRHVFAVRAYDGQGRVQEEARNPTYPAGSTGVDTETAVILPT